MRLVAVLLLALPLAGCLGSGPFPGCRQSDWEDGEVCVDRSTREFIATVPPGDGPFPLLIALHGGAGDAENMQRKTGLDAIALAEGVVVIYPQGTPAIRGGDLRTWNAAHCCGRAWDDGVDDVAFLDALIALAQEELPIDATRIGVTGHSNGGMMAHRYGAERSDTICCIMPVSGAVGGATPPGSAIRYPPTPSGPVDALIIHATDDPRVPYEGGEGKNLGSQRYDLGVEDARAFWEAAGGQVHVVSTEGGHGWPGGAADVSAAPAEPDASRLVVDWLLR